MYAIERNKVSILNRFISNIVIVAHLKLMS